MFYTVTADQITPLAAHLAELLSTPLEDPFAPEWIAVPTAGMQRWLRLELAKTLGISRKELNDGVATNLGITFPGALRETLLRPAGTDDESPWMVERLIWTTLAVLLEEKTNPAISDFVGLPQDCTLFSRARQIADLFDRYGARRPALLRRWQQGHDLDASGTLLGPSDRWQPLLWRAIRSRMEVESPAEQFPGILEAARTGDLDVELPGRLVFFGLTTFPNGDDFLDLVDAVAQKRDVYLYLLDPALDASIRCARETNQRDLLRAHDHSETLIAHPLLRSWGRPYRERMLLLEQAKLEGRIQPKETFLPRTLATAVPTSLLHKMQLDIANNRHPDGLFLLDPGDTSVQIHSCYGELRQVEALRNAILHLLAVDTTLNEEDIVVFCPDIKRFAPLIEAGFGPSIDDVANPKDINGPRLRWRLTDRTLRPIQPVFTGLEALLQIANSQASVSEVLAFISLEAVAKRFNFSTDDIATIERWVEKGHVRWAFSSEQRSHWGLPEGISQGTWEELVDRLTLGLALEDAIDLPPGGIAPIEVDTEQSQLLGRFIDLLHRLRQFILDAGGQSSIDKWCISLRAAVTTFFATDECDRWQLDQTLETIEKIRDSAQHILDLVLDELFLRDIIQIVHEGIEKIAGRSNFFRGGITVTSVLPLRWIPFRVVCLLGMDEESFGIGSAVDGDDLIARAPRLGDRDARSELRQTLLEALLTAGQCCVFTRTGRSIKTNHEVPAATVIAELVDVLTATVDQQSRELFRTTVIRNHDRHGFANDEFVPGRHFPHRAWSFSNANLEEARRRIERSRRSVPRRAAFQLPATDDTTIDIEALVTLMKHPIRFYFENRLQMSFPPNLNELDERLPVDLAGLQAWEVGTSSIESTILGQELDHWKTHERALGSLPVGELGEKALRKVQSNVDAIFQKATELGLDRDHVDLKEISVRLPGDTEVQGTIPLNLSTSGHGTLAITYSEQKEEHHLGAWIRLMALVATDAEQDWKSIVVYRKGERADALILSMPDKSSLESRELAIEALSTLTDLYRRALREPIPLFSGITQKIHNNTVTPEDWFSYRRRGPGDDRITQFAFGPVGLSDVLSLPVQPHDPLGKSTTRAQLFSDYLWDSVERTSVRDA